eukprot:scaffold322051_cov38-Prasinocladus_malaysianus.AAC.1
MQTMQIKITGYTQPDAPHFIALRISSARALEVAMYLICRLAGLAVDHDTISIALGLPAKKSPQPIDLFADDSDDA